uniref:Uncharacterized protein n=1 Tax=Octactis speculum TaxID=3111310 RepID=A0A7S2HKY0_9STRA
MHITISQLPVQKENFHFTVNSPLVISAHLAALLCTVPGSVFVLAPFATMTAFTCALSRASNSLATASAFALSNSSQRFSEIAFSIATLAISGLASRSGSSSFS